MKRRRPPLPPLLALLCLPPLAAPAPSAGAAEEGAAPADILVIMADDLGYSDLGCYGGEIATPHLDAVAAEGLRFTRFYNTGRCWPTRASLLTGYYAQQIRRDDLPGVPSGGGHRGRRPDWAALLPRLLEPAGYRSYHVGKWHVDGMPLEGGFHRSYYLRDQGRFFHPQQHFLDDEPLPPVEEDSGFYATVALADRTVAMLEEHAAQHAEKPFFIYLNFAAPHFPLHALPEDIDLYRDAYTEGWEAARERRWERIRELGLADGELPAPEYDLGPPYHFPEAFEILGPGEVDRPLPWDDLTDEQREFQAVKMAIHAAMIHRMDIEIGRVFERIREMGRWENTLVVFLSDNGASAEIMVRSDGHDPEAPPGSAASYLCLGPGWSTVSNTPFRKHKTWVHEGGTVTPLLVSWPRGIAARGELREQPGHVVDLAPTLLELAGLAPLREAPPAPGVSLAPLFADAGAELGRETLWFLHDEHRAIRAGDWKAVAAAGAPWELYDLAADPAESEDLAHRRPGVLLDLVERWEEEFSAITELATADLTPEVLEEYRETRSGRPSAMIEAREAARPPLRQDLIDPERFEIEGREAFLMRPREEDGSASGGRPWVLYLPAGPSLPDRAERWMQERLLEAGVALAGVDAGAAWGSPRAFPLYQSLYEEMAERGYSVRPALLARDAGGLCALAWAVAHPGGVAGIGGIRPAFDLLSHPGAGEAAAAYGMPPEELNDRQMEFNPVRAAASLATAGVPLHLLHGDADEAVPLAPNSRRLAEIYEEQGAAGLVELNVFAGRGHDYWPGYFFDEGLAEFLVERARAGAGPDLASCFSPPAEFAGDYGGYRSPLLFEDGREAAGASDWAARRAEILETWHGLMGPWPEVITEPEVEILASEEVEGHVRHRVRFLWTPEEETEGYLLVPAGATAETPAPAVLTVFYDPETAVGLGDREHRDFALQLTRRGFVTLSIGTTEATAARTYALYWPSLENAEVQPLSMLAYAAANAWHVLASRPEVDPERIGVTGHSFGGKWAMFASCLYEKFAAAAWSDPGIVFDTRSSVNYWEPWYLGYHPPPWRERGVPTEENPARGLYPELLAAGRDLHELHALMAPRPFFVSGGSEDPPSRWRALNHSVAVNRLFGFEGRVGMHNRPEHGPNPESNRLLYEFFEKILMP